MKKLLPILFLALTFAIASCATEDRFREARALVEQGNAEEGLARVEKMVEENPQDAELRNYYQRQRAVMVQRELDAGDQSLAAGAHDQASAAYLRAQRFDPQNARAAKGLEAVERDREHRKALAEAQSALKTDDTDAAYARAKEVLSENPANREARAIVRRIDEKKNKETMASPKLAAALKKTVTLEFRDAPLRSVFELLSKHTGFNFVFDRDVNADLKATVFVRDTTIEDVLKFVLVTNQLERKVLNDNTVLVYPNTPVKQQAYKDLVVKSFYLANADVKQTANMVRSLAKTRDLYIDEKLNLLVIRDTPEAVRMVEKLIAAQDLSEPEVMLEVEVLEVGHTQLANMGIQWPTSVGFGVIGATGIPGEISGRELQNFNGNNARVTITDPAIAINLRKQVGRTNVLANPRIRVKNREKARIHIGDKVPVVTTTAGATGFVSESVNYLDVGLKLEVEPQVFLEDDVGIKVGLEVSNISSEVTVASGTTAYQVGTRNAATSLRLKDGETQVLAGLINSEDRRSADKVPGLSRLPLLGRLFTNKNDTVNKTEIVLLITPRVIRNINRPEARLEEFNSGTEAEVGGMGGGVPGAPLAPPYPPLLPQEKEKPAATAPAAPAAPWPPAAGPQPMPQQR